MTEPVSIRLAPPGERHRDVPVPSETPWPEWNEALAGYLALARRADEAREEFNQTLADRDAAEAADREAIAAAARKGAPEPSGTKLAKAEERERAARRRSEGLTLAVDQAAQELVELVQANRDGWAKVLAERIASDSDQEAKAFERYLAAARQRAASESLRDFVAGFPANKSFRPAASPHVKGLLGRNGDPYTLEEIVAALPDQQAVTA